MLSIRGNLNQKNSSKVALQFASNGASVITVEPFLIYNWATDQEIVDFFYGDVEILAEGWRFPTGVEIKMNYFDPKFWEETDGVSYHALSTFVLTDSNLQKLYLQGTSFVDIDISRNSLDYVDVTGCERIESFRAPSNFLNHQRFLGLDSLGIYNSVPGDPPAYTNPVNGLPIKAMNVLDLQANLFSEIPYLDSPNRMVWYEYNISNNNFSGVFAPPGFAQGLVIPSVLNISFNNFSSVDFGAYYYGDFPVERPKVFDCSFNPNLTTLDENILNGYWLNAIEIKCNHCQIDSIEFPPSVSGAPYQIRYLDVSYNNLDTLDVSSLVDLRYLYANNNSLTSLAYPGEYPTSFTATPNAEQPLDSRGNYAVDQNGNPFWVYLNTYRLTECDISTNLFTQNPFSDGFEWQGANGLRYFNISGNPISVLGLSTISSSYISNKARLISATFNTSTRLFRAANSGGFRIKPGDVVVFTGATGLNNGYTQPQNTPYIVNNYEPLDWGSTTSSFTNFVVADKIDAVPTDAKSHALKDPDKVNITSVIHSGSSFTMAHYPGRFSTSTPFLSKLLCTDCPNLTRVSLWGLTGLDYCDVSNNPVLTQLWTGLTAMHSDPVRSATPIASVANYPAWEFGPAWLKTLLANNCPSLNLDRNLTLSFANKPNPQWDKLSLRDCNLSNLFLNIGAICRKGFDFSLNNFNSSALGQVLSRLGNRSLLPSTDPDDTNIVDVSGNPGPYSGSTYTSNKNQAISRGWQIVEN